MIIDPLAIDRSSLTTFVLSASAARSDPAADERDGPSLVAQGAAEDNEMSLAVQRGLRAGANDTLVFGRNESALGHFHRNLDELLAVPATAMLR